MPSSRFYPWMVGNVLSGGWCLVIDAWTPDFLTLYSALFLCHNIYCCHLNHVHSFLCHSLLVCYHRLPSLFFSFVLLASFILYHRTTSIIPVLSLTRTPSLLQKTASLSTADKSIATNTMCIKIIERYAACHCIYYEHAIDPCPAYGRRGHGIRTKEVSVGYKCSRHSMKRSEPAPRYDYPDSGYGSGTGSRPQSSGFRR